MDGERRIFLFREVFKLTKQEENDLLHICIFIVTIYTSIDAWFSSTSAISAPYNDFMLLRQIYNFENIDKDIAQVALK